MAAKIPTAQRRLFGNVFICKNCSKKIRSQAVRIISGKVKCPKCSGRSFRAIKKK
jgi:DNA-directed RNA polymerase subunit RPC12/RpoP